MDVWVNLSFFTKIQYKPHGGYWFSLRLPILTIEMYLNNRVGAYLKTKETLVGIYKK